MMSDSDILRRYARIAVAGVPRAGKTSLLEHYEVLLEDLPWAGPKRILFHTDDLQDAVWEEIPGIICQTLNIIPAYMVEGVQVARALRKGLKPDVVLFFPDVHPAVEPTAGQKNMGKGVLTIMKQWYDSEDRTTPVLVPESPGSWKTWRWS